MNGSKPLGALRRTINDRLVSVRQSRFFGDRLSVWLMVTALAVNGLTFVSLGMWVRPVDAPVPVRFSSLTTFDALGPWYHPFLIAGFAVVITLANSVFAYHSFSRSRLASFFLLMGAGVVAIFALIISNAFGVAR